MSVPITARVIRDWTEKDAAQLRKEGLLSFPMLAGTVGILQKPDQRVKGYMVFDPKIQCLVRWKSVFSSKGLKGIVFVPEKYLELGHPVQRIPAIHGLHNPANIAKVDRTSQITFASLLTAFLESCVLNKESLGLAGVSSEQLALLQPKDAISRMVTNMIQGFKNMGTLDLFWNGMPTLQEIASKTTEAKKLPNDVKAQLNGKMVLYITIYACEDGSPPTGIRAHCFWGMSAKGIKYVDDEQLRIESASPAHLGFNHYETAKKFLHEKNGKWAIFPIAMMETPQLANGERSWHTWLHQAVIALGHSYHPATDFKIGKATRAGPFWSGSVSRLFSDISKKLTQTENPQHPAPFPNFGPSAISDLIHGLDFNSPVMEVFHTEAGIWTRSLMRHEDGKPHCWIFRGPPRKVRDNADPTDPNRTHITLFTRPMPAGMNSAESTQSFNIPLRQDAGAPWEVKQGDYVIPLVEIMRDANAVHHHAYTAAQDVGPFDTWHQALRIAYRIEYVDAEGNWKTRYLKYDADPTYYKSLAPIHGNKKEVQSLEKGWAQAISVLATFIYQWKENSGGISTNLINAWPIKLRTSELDFFEQKIRLFIPTKEDVPRPKLLSPIEKAALMQEAFVKDKFVDRRGHHWKTPFTSGEITEMLGGVHSETAFFDAEAMMDDQK
ncbi:hypothetical protein LX36DRAFT_747045 [Colletotrichum falcatum]|nr:hypothetical protein LX36DRAFT_747045 [Colletotrichum falcatum]